MNTLQFVIKKKGDGYYFSNRKTGSENEVFTNKFDACKILMDLLDNKRITKCHAVELLQNLFELREFPIASQTRSSQLESDLIALALIAKFNEALKEMTQMETEKDLPKFKVCENCGKHGQIIGSDFLTRDFYDKKTARHCVDDLISKGGITREEEEKILGQINESNLDEISAEESTIMN